MKNTLKKALALLCAVTVMLSVFSGLITVSASETAADLTDIMVGNDKERVDKVTVAGRDCFMYVPESNRVGNFLTLTPMVMVFGDEKYTEESALACAKENGFADLAKRDGLCILFVNPIESWDSEADAAAAADLFAGFFKIFSSLPTLKFVNGVAEYKEADGSITVRYPGSLHGVQMFGEGKGADYVAANYLKNNVYGTNYATQVFDGLLGTPSGVALFGPSSIPANEEELVIPMAVVNGPADSQDLADSYNVDAGIDRVVRDSSVEGFDEDLVKSLYDEVVAAYYYSQGQFRKIEHYNLNGIVEVNNTIDVKAVGSVWAPVEEGATVPLEYYAYVPENIDVTKKGSVPMLVWLHGMGGEGEAMLSWTEWPLVGRDNGFVVVSVDQHTNFQASQIMEMIDYVLGEWDFIDPSRVFAGGFSMGSATTWQLGLTYPERFAGIMPDALGLFGAASAAMNEKAATGMILPTFYIAGGQSAMELGSSNFTQSAQKVLWQLNNIGEYEYDSANEWGVKADSVLTVNYLDNADYVVADSAKRQVLEISAFESKDGNTYTWLSVNKYKPHTVTNNDAHIVWEYMKNFYRKADGSIGILEEAPADTTVAEALTKEMVGSTEHIDKVTVAGRECYMYVPESNRVGNFLALTPMVMVLDDGKYTAESALKEAKENGFAEIAERDGTCVLFVNPKESWDSAADAAAAADLFKGFFQIYSSDPTMKFVNGVATVTDAETGETSVRYPGSLHGVQMFGNGKGADYISANFMENNKYDTNYAIQYFNDLDGYPSGVALFNPSELEGNSQNLVIPTAIVNGPADAVEVAVSFNKDLGICETVNAPEVEGFDRDLVVSLYDEVVSKYYYSQGQFREVEHYNLNGIVEVNNTIDVKAVASAWGPAPEEGATVPLEYYAYVPSDIDITADGTVPLLIWLHGMGGEGEAMLSWTEWPLVAKENGFVVVSVDQHTSFQTDQFMEMIDYLLDKWTFLDDQRVFAGGFSMGSAATWQLGLTYPERFAGIFPDALGLFGAASDKMMENAEKGMILPTVYIAGGQSAMELGSSNFTQSALKVLWPLNNISDEYAYDAELGRWGDTSYSTLNENYLDLGDFIIDEHAKEQVFIVDDFTSEDGNTYTYLCLNKYKPHTVTNHDARHVWPLIGKYFRQQDGTIGVVGVDERICVHKDTEVRDAKEPTCTEEGYTGDIYCAECGELLEEGKPIPATGHTEEVRGAKEPTCTEEGYTGDVYCSECGELLRKGSTIPATGHTDEDEDNFCDDCGIAIVPHTGDESHTAVWSVVFLSAALMLVLIMRKRRANG